MSLQQIDNNLDLALDQQFLADIVLFRQQRLKSFSGVLEKMIRMLSALRDEKSVYNVISSGVDDFMNIASQLDDDTLAAQIVKRVHIVTEKIPDRIILTQHEFRFVPLEEDPWFAASVKTGKRFIQKLGKTNWEQRVPLQKVITYHLLDATDSFKTWVDEDEGMLLRIILELEQALVKEASAAGKNVSPSALQQVLKVFINQLNERINALERERELDAARSSLKAQIMEAISKAGTLEQIPVFYSANGLQVKAKRTHKRLTGYINEWQHVNMQMLEKIETMHQFLSLSENLKCRTDTFTNDIEAYLDQLFFKPFVQLKEKLAFARRKIESTPEFSADTVRAIEKPLLDFTEQQLVIPVQKSLETSGLHSRIEQAGEELVAVADNVDERAVFVSKLNQAAKPPELKAREVEWRLLIVRGIKEEIVSGLELEDDTVEEKIEEQLNELKEIQEIIEVNLQSAIQLSVNKKSTDDPLEIADDALERTQNKVEKCKQQVQKIKEAICLPVQEGRRDFVKNMMELLHRADVSALSMLDAKYKVGEKTSTGQAKARTYWARTKEKTGAISRFISIKAKKFYTKGSTLIGLKKKDVQERQKSDIAAWLLETEQKIQQLPYIYRQLFAIDTVSERRNYVGINENFGILRNAYERWQEGVPTSCAVVGEKGSGKSSYLHLVNKELFDGTDVWSIDLNKTIWTESELLSLFDEWADGESFETVDDLVVFLNKQNSQIIVFEGIHNLYLRHLNGYEGIEQLIYLISETSANVFWMVSCSRYAWSFLCEAVGLTNYFSPVIRTDMLDEQQTERLILNRHNSSGYELVFEADEGYDKNRTYRKVMSDEAKAQEHLRQKYFKELTELAKGNASIAIIFWIRSIRDFDDTQFYIKPLEADSLDMADDLTPETLFVLAAIILHDTLNAEELSAVLGISQKESKLIFNRLKAKGIVITQENGIGLNHLMYRQTIRELKERNILHLE